MVSPLIHPQTTSQPLISSPQKLQPSLQTLSNPASNQQQTSKIVDQFLGGRMKYRKSENPSIKHESSTKNQNFRQIQKFTAASETDISTKYGIQNLKISKFFVILRRAHGRQSKNSPAHIKLLVFLHSKRMRNIYQMISIRAATFLRNGFQMTIYPLRMNSIKKSESSFSHILKKDSRVHLQ